MDKFYDEQIRVVAIQKKETKRDLRKVEKLQIELLNFDSVLEKR
jgi:hypothetical protein